jgi:hypothetical protein
MGNILNSHVKLYILNKDDWDIELKSLIDGLGPEESISIIDCHI